jgi:hypothetical protein
LFDDEAMKRPDCKDPGTPEPVVNVGDRRRHELVVTAQASDTSPDSDRTVRNREWPQPRGMTVCGRPFGFKAVLQRFSRAGSGASVCPAFDAAFITAAGLYGDRGSGPDRVCALEAPGHFTGFPDPVF